MKLKEAIKIAATKGYNYVAVDKDKRIFAHLVKPSLSLGTWSEYMLTHLLISETYTGSKPYTDTLRTVTGG